MAIPRFNARIGQIQVPTLQNYQEKQNESIANSLAQFGNQIFHASLKLYLAKGRGDSNLFELTEEVNKASSADRS